MLKAKTRPKAIKTLVRISTPFIENTSRLLRPVCYRILRRLGIKTSPQSLRLKGMRANLGNTIELR